MMESNPGIWRLHEIWNDGPEGKAAVITVAALIVGGIAGLIYLCL